MQKIKIVLLLFLAINCAKKAPPPSPDRWAPRLRNVEVINRRHLLVIFSESVDPKNSVEISNYNCRETGTDIPLKILAATVRTGNEISLTTSIQSRLSYTLTLSGIKDLSGNMMDVQTVRFMGSEVPDLHPPRIMDNYPIDGSTNFQPDSGVIFRFSEVMDTVSIFRNCELLPEGDLRVEWDEGMTEFHFFPSKLESGEVYSFYLKDGCKDLDGNRMENWGILTFTPDSTLPYGHVSGYLVNSKKGTTVIALVDNLLQIVRIALVSNSTFRIDWIPPADYTILAGRDLDDDRSFDLIAHQEVNISEEGAVVELLLKEVTEKWRIFERLERIFAVD